MSYNTSNYTEQGGATTVIGGELQIAGELQIVDGGSITAAGSQASEISDIAITYTLGDPDITPNGAVTVANGATPTVGELLELCEEIIANQNAIIDALQGAGIVATA